MKKREKLLLKPYNPNELMIRQDRDEFRMNQIGSGFNTLLYFAHENDERNEKLIQFNNLK